MDQNDRQAIEGLFSKLSQVEGQSQPRDAEAERFIAAQVARQPGAPYYMAQTIVMQDYALTQAQTRVEELQRALATARQSGALGGGLFGRLFGGGQAAPQGQGRPAAPPPQGGGFLAGAAQTAMGVAGGMMLANALSGVFAGPDEAGAADLAAEDSGADAGLDEDADWG